MGHKAWYVMSGLRERGRLYVMWFDIFLIKGTNIEPPLSDESFVMTVAFVQESTTYLAEVNYTCLLFLIWNSVKVNGVSWTNYQQKSNLSVLKLSVGSSTSPKTDRPWKTSSLAPGNTSTLNYVQGFWDFLQSKYEIRWFENYFSACFDQVPVQMETETN
jgi:hypothetical protein